MGDKAISKIVFKLSKVAFGLVTGCLIILLIFFTGSQYACKKEFILPNIVLILISAVLVVIGFAVYSFLNKKLELFKYKIPDTNNIVYFTVIVLFLWQCYAAYNIFFLTGWDVGNINKTAQDIASGNTNDLITAYYSTYPNNLFTVYFQVVILKINNAFGIFVGEFSLMSVVIINCLINSFSCFLVYETAKVFVKKQMALIGFCFAVLTIGFSPWTVIGYSDSLALFVPVFSLYLYVRQINNRYIRYTCRLGSVIISMVGYFIKPQCAIVGIAIILVEIFRLLENFKLKKLIKPVALCLAVILTVTCVNFIINFANKKVGMTIDRDRIFGPSHFFMMGLNETTKGVYQDEDVVFSRSFINQKERTLANLNVAKERIKAMGVVGLLNQLKNKMLTTFNDGTFAWAEEGSFYRQTFGDVNSKMSPFLKSVYYTYGNKNQYTILLQHFVWITVFMLSFASVFVGKKITNKWQIIPFWVTVLGFVLYELLFEVRARYLYIFVPVFCVLAVVGIQNIIWHINKTVKKDNCYKNTAE